eukprot:6942888-Alexandrium_andersonii.AAC.1
MQRSAARTWASTQLRRTTRSFAGTKRNRPRTSTQQKSSATRCVIHDNLSWRLSRGVCVLL